MENPHVVYMLVEGLLSIAPLGPSDMVEAHHRKYGEKENKVSISHFTLSIEFKMLRSL